MEEKMVSTIFGRQGRGRGGGRIGAYVVVVVVVVTTLRVMSASASTIDTNHAPCGRDRGLQHKVRSRRIHRWWRREGSFQVVRRRELDVDGRGAKQTKRPGRRETSLCGNLCSLRRPQSFNAFGHVSGNAYRGKSEETLATDTRNEVDLTSF